MKNLLFCFGKTKIFGNYTNSSLLKLKLGTLLLSNIEDIAWHVISKHHADKQSSIKKNIPYISTAKLLEENEIFTLSIQNLLVEFEDDNKVIIYKGYKILYNLNTYYVSELDDKVLLLENN